MIFVNKTSEVKTVICNAGRDKDIVDTPPLEILVVSLDVRGVKSHKLENTRNAVRIEEIGHFWSIVDVTNYGLNI